MKIDGNIGLGTFQNKIVPKSVQKSRNENFGVIFSLMKGLITETNNYQLLAQKADIGFATSKTYDTFSTGIAREKAHISLELTIQLTNKILDSYREIMQMQL